MGKKQDGGRSVAIVPKETKDAHKIPKPARVHFENQQLNLFQSFLANTDAERDRLSNAVDLWDNVPRYSITPRAMSKARVGGKFLEHHEAEFQYRDRTFKRTIFPARAQDLDGVHRDFYPSANEELVEDALRKLAIDQQAGYFDKPTFRSGVMFSLHELREELKRRGHARSYQQIVLSLNILSGSVIQIDATDGGEGFERSTYIPHLAAATRKRLKDDPKARWIVQFHPLVTASIDKLTYRQFNYDLLMRLDTQLARWLHKQLVLKYTFASITTPFEMRYSTIKRDSGLLDGYERDRKGIEAVDAAFADLTKKELLLMVKRANITGPRGKLLDVVFTLTPSLDFVRDTKAASRRLLDARAHAEGP